MEFPNLIQLNAYKDKLNNFKIGELIYLTDVEKYVMYNGENFVDVPTSVKNDSGLSMNLYDLNKSIISQLPIKSTYAEQKAERALIDEFCKKHGHSSYMLLCKDISYYTIFTYEGIKMCDFETLGQATLDCLLNVGNLICADNTPEGNAIEIWVRTPEEDNLCMYLFKCDDLMVTYGR
jgi:hypothetical protein